MNYNIKNKVCQVKNSDGKVSLPLNNSKREGSSLFNLEKVDHSLFEGFWGCEPSLSFCGDPGEGKGENRGVSATLLDKARISRQKKGDLERVVVNFETGIEVESGENTPQKPDKSGSGEFEGEDSPAKRIKFTKEYYQTRLKSCGNKYALLECQGCGLNYVARIGCGFRTCPVCARELSNRMFYGIWKVVKRLPVTPVYKLRLITLGYGTKGDLRSRILGAKKAFKKLYRNLLEKKGAGAFVTLEIGEKTGSVHLHVGYYGPWVSQKRLSEEWGRVTGGQWYADIRLMKGKNGIREVTKYITKEVVRNNKDLDWLYEVELSMRGLRRFMTYGIFYDRGVFKPSFVCPVCGCSEWGFVRHLDCVLDKGLIQEVQDSFLVFAGDIRSSPFDF